MGGELMDAYAVKCDGKTAILRMTKASYDYSYGAMLSSHYLKYLPDGWKSFSVFDIPRKQWICGQTREIT